MKTKKLTNKQKYWTAERNDFRCLLDHYDKWFTEAMYSYDCIIWLLWKVKEWEFRIQEAIEKLDDEDWLEVVKEVLEEMKNANE